MAKLTLDITGKLRHRWAARLGLWLLNFAAIETRIGSQQPRTESVLHVLLKDDS